MNDEKRNESDPELDKDEAADAFETAREAEDNQRDDTSERREEDITTLDPPD